jgi:hypothetical protein
VSKFERGPARRDVRVYLTLDDLAEILDVEPDRLSISHVDQAPDSKTHVVRICLTEKEDGWELFPGGKK